MRGLRNSGALVTTHSAECATLDQVRHLLAVSSPDVAAAVSLAWRTASRWGDLEDLSAANFLQVEDCRITLEWGRTKSNQELRDTMSSLVVIASVVPMPEIVNFVRQLRRGVPFCTIRTDKFRAILAADTSTAELTAHSLKNGAADVLLHHAILGRVDKSLIPRVTKHSEGDRSERLPSVTQGYFKDKVRRAQLLETEKVTIWLDPFRVENH